MPIDEVNGQPWTRKHDNLLSPVVPNAPRVLYPKSLQDLIDICANRKPSERIHAAGSHWALSDAALSDNVFVETHDPNNAHQAMGKTLYDVVPPCLSPAFINALADRQVPEFNTENVGENQGLYPIHIETGKRVYQLYAELDFGTEVDFVGSDKSRSLATLLSKRGNPTYLGSWAFPTLGGAGGQTVFGALTTGTHGGDFRMPPIADAVMAMHLVADGGKHYWIEPSSLTKLGVPLTDDELLKGVYGGLGNFEVIRDDDIFNSVLISVGRFGIVYSIVIAAVRQYSLHQERRITTWQEIKSQINDPNSDLYTKNAQSTTPKSPNKFLQVAISVTPHENFTKNLAGVTKRWNVPLAAIPGASVPAGRLERRGEVVTRFDMQIQAPRFEFAGNSSTYSPDPSRPGMALPPNFLARACSNGNFIVGVIEEVVKEIRAFIDSNGTVIGAGLLAVTAAGGGLLILQTLLVALNIVILPILVAFLIALRALGQPRFGQVMNDLRDALLNPPDPLPFPITVFLARLAGILVWQIIVYEVFRSQQENADFEAISYAVMDGHDYFDKSCNVNVDSIEVFFDAKDPMLIAFIDALLAFEVTQEGTLGKAFAGFISLRFMGSTRALIGPQRFPLTCAVEVAGLRDTEGVTELIDFAISLALNDNFKGILHWGQRNESQRSDIEERFDGKPNGNLHRWRQALSRITQDGRLDGFSSAFTRRTGLELSLPIQPVTTDSDSGAVLQTGGRLVAFIRGTDNNVYHRWQTTNNGEWSQWGQIGAPPNGAVGGPDAALNALGGLVCFIRGADGAVWHAWQPQPDGDWSGWESLILQLV
jgi:hypothetical protein